MIWMTALMEDPEADPQQDASGNNSSGKNNAHTSTAAEISEERVEK
jgi:hypothetical protein